ncbi:MFS transporter [Microbulbifer sp. VAAF005]|uniref:MFS transporter n=1 Tax=Microbulbifer sp. VAAF005 TaxID=3034230 RepID=UPI0024AE59F5|nr:MFS transporter [Microbulbifer sp. VAAF005]WHI45810.1 MFS transporter [Microbulbifer sp. VAAF005]
MSSPTHFQKINWIVASQGAAQVILLTQIPLIIEYCGLDLATLGALVAVSTFCLMIAGPIWGELGDKIGRKPILLFGLSGALLSQVLFVALLVALAQGHLETDSALIALVASRVLYGLNAAAIFPCCQAWALELGEKDQQLSILSGISAAANLGRGLGPLLALPALIAGSLWPLLWLLLLPFSALILTLFLPQSPEKTITAKETEKTNLPTATISLFTIALLGTVSIGQLQVVMGPVLQDLYGLSALGASSTTAVLLASVAICGFLVQVGLVRKIERPQISLMIGVLCVCLGTMTLSLTLGSALAAPGLMLFVVGVAFLVPGYSALVSRGQQRSGRLFGLLSLMHTGGYTIGFALGGWLYEQSSSQPLIGMLFSVSLIAILTLTNFVISWKKSPNVSAI